MQRPIHRDGAGVGIDALFKAGGRIAALTQGAGGLSHAVARELGGFKEDFLRLGLYLAVEAAHDARERHTALAVADEKVIGVQAELLFVEGDDALALFGTAHDDLPAAQEIAVERVHGLPHFKQHKVGDVDDIGNRAQAAKRQAAAHPAGRGADLHVLHEVPHIARAKGRLLYFNGDLDVRLRRRIGKGGQFEGLFEDGGDFARDAEDALAVGAVGGDGDIEEIVVDADDRADVRADGLAFIEDEDAVDLGALVIVVGDAQLLARAHHALGKDAAQFTVLDFLHAALVEDGRAVERAGHLCPREDVGRRRADLLDAVLAAVHLADGEPVRIGVLFGGEDLAHDDVRDVFAKVSELLYLKPAREELFLQLLGGNIDIHIIF